MALHAEELMQIPVQMTSRGVELTHDQATQIREAAAELDRFFDGLVSCRITVSVPNKRPVDGPVTWTFRLGLTVPGGVLAINRRARPSFRQALDDAFDAARRRLQDYARELRGDTKHHGDETVGSVSRLLAHEGYGFITGADGDEIYFHRNSVPDGGFDRLMVGMAVRYVEAEGERGPQASTVVPLGHPAAALTDLP
jgi:cold shock CspA family protein